MARDKNDRRAEKKRRAGLLRQRQNHKPSFRRVAQPSAKVSGKLQFVYGQIEDRNIEQAELEINRLVKQNPQIPAIIEAKVYLHQTAKDWEQAGQAAKQLQKLTPHDPDATMMYAQSSLYCSRVCVAVREYRKFLKRWPDHENAAKARTAIEICEPECKSRLVRAHSSGFTDLTFENGGLELFARHEESLEQLRAGNFDAAIQLCLAVLKTEPRFLSARNNLATCYFQTGDLENAMTVARETCRLNPHNRFAEANLAKLEMLGGNEAVANAIADRIVASPPAEQDATVAAIEAMSYLGRDRDVALLGAVLEQIPGLDDDSRAIGLHHCAVAAWRMGEERKADSLWKRCLKILPSHREAKANLDDIRAGTGHAAWADPVEKWIPLPLLNRLNGKSAKYKSIDNEDFPEGRIIQSMIPALLDRGDPIARELALMLAKSVASQPMFDALKTFALGQRGPDSLRNDALMFLHGKEILDEGPHRFFSRGKWIPIQLFAPEISGDFIRETEPWKIELARAGYEAQVHGDDDRAEMFWRQILERDPEDLSATFNLAIVWLNRNDQGERKKALAKLEELHEKHPDYIFATIALARIAADTGDPERANRLVGVAMKQKRLHTSEASALFGLQVDIALARRQIGSAEIAYPMLVSVVGAKHPAAIQARQRIDSFAAQSMRGKGI